ncbi:MULTISPECIES: NAD(P)/FAD-dependent oxidoreductase [unclassified Spirosoma]|uniref:NAD(P)/FAD-dependent oxidoreductase n=1 Tax=unclassified Spirosoma TaxID=2621999 RepID=UPI00095ACB80|nr:MULTISPECIES: NAD(P)/FAD-dependent oxidoreductase [unclassified Spirosoma]MBN8825118.1 NAD(P)/FAD-dependent oxidoreductase [Spirosoma sp.]OJW77191.1 MAG: flavoprotein [Spirosoma sp. 48-14]
MSSLRIVVIGGGAAGFFGAITAAETFPDATITVLEKSRTVLNKVRISGGGRCNVTHACFDNKKLVKYYPRGEKPLRNLLNQFDATTTVRWFEAHGVALKTEADGRMFPSTNTSETIVTCLMGTARRLGIQVRTSCGVSTLTPTKTDDGQTVWQVALLNDEVIQADRVLIATGGYPQASSYQWLPQQTEALVSPVPSLFTFNVPESYLLPLAGVSVSDAAVSIQGTKQEQRGPLLLTHWGFSGPAILRLSAWAARELAAMDYRFTLRINWVPTLNEHQLRNLLQDYRQQNGRKQVSSQNPFGLPNRLWQIFVSESGMTDAQRWADLPAKLLNRLIERLTNSQFQVVGKTTFKDEFVTCGGITVDSLNPQTLESKTQPGLFFAGEVLDIDGITGGFNFQNAWTTGYIAGKHIGQGLASIA